MRKQSVATGALVVGLGCAPMASSGSLRAQHPSRDPHAVQPERPSVATHAGTVGVGWIELEVGGQWDRSAGVSAFSAPLLAKIGLGSRFQLSLANTLLRPPGSTLGVGDFAAGLKWRLVEAAPLAGDVAVFPSIKVPTGSAASNTGTGTTDVGLLLISSHVLGSVALDVNLGYTRRSGDGSAAPRSATLWTVSWGGPVRGRWGWVGEVFGYPGTSGPAGSAASAAVLAGPSWMASPWLVLDAGFILPLAGPQPRSLFAGATYNVGRLWDAGGHAAVGLGSPYRLVPKQ